MSSITTQNQTYHAICREIRQVIIPLYNANPRSLIWTAFQQSEKDAVIALPKIMRCKFQTKLNPHLLPQYPIHGVSDSCRCKALVVRYASNTELGVVVAHLQIPTSGMLRPEAYVTDQPELQNDRRKVFINRI